MTNSCSLAAPPPPLLARPHAVPNDILSQGGGVKPSPQCPDSLGTLIC